MVVGDTEMVPITHFCSRRNSLTTEVALRFGEARLQTIPLSTGAAARYSHALYTHTGRYLIPNLSAVIPRSHLHPPRTLYITSPSHNILQNYLLCYTSTTNKQTQASTEICSFQNHHSLATFIHTSPWLIPLLLSENIPLRRSLPN